MSNRSIVSKQKSKLLHFDFRWGAVVEDVGTKVMAERARIRAFV